MIKEEFIAILSENQLAHGCVSGCLFVDLMDGFYLTSFASSRFISLPSFPPSHSFLSLSLSGAPSFLLLFISLHSLSFPCSITLLVSNSHPLLSTSFSFILPLFVLPLSFLLSLPVPPSLPCWRPSPCLYLPDFLPLFPLPFSIFPSSSFTPYLSIASLFPLAFPASLFMTLPTPSLPNFSSPIYFSH